MSDNGYTPWGASCHRARVEVLLMLARHLALQHRQLLAVHGAGKHGVCDAHNEPRPQRGGQIHLKEQDADDHGHPCHLQHGAGISRLASNPTIQCHSLNTAVSGAFKPLQHVYQQAQPAWILMQSAPPSELMQRHDSVAQNDVSNAYLSWLQRRCRSREGLTLIQSNTMSAEPGIWSTAKGPCRP